MNQNTKEWLAWRVEGIGASDAPIIMGKSKYKNITQLWNEKVNKKIEDKEDSFILEKGHKIEAWARPGIEFYTGMEFKPALFSHEQFNFIRASLDGWNNDNKIAWECKFIGKDLWECLSDEKKKTKDRIPDQYYDQICHQFFVTGAEKILLTGVKEEKDENDNKKKIPYTLEIKRTKEIEEYITKELAPTLLLFWKSVQEKVPPKMPDNMMIDYEAAFKAMIDWLSQVKKMNNNEIVAHIKSVPDVPRLERYMIEKPKKEKKKNGNRSKEKPNV